MHLPMEPEAQVRQNAAALESRIAAARLDLPDQEHRQQRAGAIAEMQQYVAMLREAAGSAPTRYWFKLDLPDGRWDVAEQPLAASPRVGDVVDVADRRWQILGTQWVNPFPSGKPPREFFVCAPAA